MNRSSLLFATAITVLTLLSCQSWELTSTPGAPYYSVNYDRAYSLKISLVKIEGAELGQSNKALSKGDARSFSAASLQQIGMKKYPFLFSRNKPAIPLAIDMSFGNYTYQRNWVSFFFGFVTATLSPFLGESERQIVVSVRIQSSGSDDSIEVGDTAYQIIEKRAVSFLSPIGGWVYELDRREAREWAAERVVDSVVSTILDANQKRLGEIYQERKAKRTL